MAKRQQVGSLELNQDLEQTRHEWAVERAGWVGMALVVLMALLGLLGRGPLSGARAETASLRVEYHRFERYASPYELHLFITPGMAQDDEVRLSMNRAYLEEVQIKTITPEPERMESGNDQTIFVFALSDPAQPLLVTYDLEAKDFGRLAAELEIEGEPSIRFAQFFYP